MNKIWTGERLETHILNETAIEHLHRYAIALEYVQDKIVLDIASGEGYGSNLIANKAKAVFGIDIDNEAIENAKKKYNKSNLSFQLGSTSKIPIEDNAIDIVISFETIEHHDQHEAMMLEIKRVLKSDGILIISSPDKKYYTDIPQHYNPYHIKELYREEFKLLINKYFSYTQFYNQRFLSCSFVISENHTDKIDFYTGDYNGLQMTNFTPVYNISIASNEKINQVQTSVFIGQNLLEELNRQLVERYLQTTTWKIGNFFVKPIAYVRDFFRKGR